ncbi:hypothetical protein TMatcc_006801 [Talaromyces marneffei ATCC 18224]|uniref:Uncharacterized protein n=1 Tax=Talaromyces marneffei (strain ATCC 18224 / CBS 334.59 / QM 7333) TaxID=441960 RepID=B6QD75_TALMQ|nr:conserved hypothetical protein [Talaromyces marneffei ATCC 18224]KAE8553744.1 hypothetical protein EYB25_005126 [Talaromyces marneffei]
MYENIWYRDLRGRTFEIGEDDTEQNVKVVEMLTEGLDESMAQMLVRANGRIQETGTKVMVLISYDVKPDNFDIDDLEDLQADVKFHRGLEPDIIDLLFKIGHGPGRIDSCFYEQAEISPCPGGFIYLDAMEQVPGDDVEEIMDDLSDKELLSIRKQLAYILNELGKIKVTMGVNILVSCNMIE